MLEVQLVEDSATGPAFKCSIRMVHISVADRFPGRVGVANRGAVVAVKRKLAGFGNRTPFGGRCAQAGKKEESGFSRVREGSGPGCQAEPRILSMIGWNSEVSASGSPKPKQSMRLASEIRLP